MADKITALRESLLELWQHQRNESRFLAVNIAVKFDSHAVIRLRKSQVAEQNARAHAIRVLNQRLSRVSQRTAMLAVDHTGLGQFAMIMRDHIPLRRATLPLPAYGDIDRLLPVFLLFVDFTQMPVGLRRLSTDIDNFLEKILRAIQQSRP